MLLQPGYDSGAVRQVADASQVGAHSQQMRVIPLQATNLFSLNTQLLTPVNMATAAQLDTYRQSDMQQA